MRKGNPYGNPKSEEPKSERNPKAESRKQTSEGRDRRSAGPHPSPLPERFSWRKARPHPPSRGRYGGAGPGPLPPGEGGSSAGSKHILRFSKFASTPAREPLSRGNLLFRASARCLCRRVFG